MADRARGGSHRAAWAVAGLAATAAGGAVWSTVLERQWYALRRITVPVLRPGSWPIRVLHLSDLHILPRHHRKMQWVSALADLRPDLVVNTGDTLSSTDAVPSALRAFGGLLEVPGAFVFGNNDYFAPQWKSPHRYFTRSKPLPKRGTLPWRDLRAAQSERGWIDLSNRKSPLELRGQRIALAGVDDPHLGRDRYEEIAGPADASAVVRIGVAHSPEPRVLDAFAGDGYDLVLAGHTHGGQVRLPLLGPVVTNCGIDRSRARGLSRWGESMWLNVSAGLGNSPYMPARFCCRPEATLITLVPREPGDAPMPARPGRSAEVSGAPLQIR
ncbi:metallophosphoesterase [Nakamurella sp. YIM 132087]|uniref:Metallophosphoesterase n=1 Tax=Nakamurella alba TaxID=2665158 RepID=A0A7K1FSG2_9ACTN|nr:metallophosphoesterase [Nakamurella alba]MTD17076.1 metallophosphoesterase [Nakamurella alba]